MLSKEKMNIFEFSELERKIEVEPLGVYIVLPEGSRGLKNFVSIDAYIHCRIGKVSEEVLDEMKRNILERLNYGYIKRERIGENVTISLKRDKYMGKFEVGLNYGKSQVVKASFYEGSDEVNISVSPLLNTLFHNGLDPRQMENILLKYLVLFGNECLASKNYSEFLRTIGKIGYTVLMKS